MFSPPLRLKIPKPQVQKRPYNSTFNKLHNLKKYRHAVCRNRLVVEVLDYPNLISAHYRHHKRKKTGGKTLTCTTLAGVKNLLGSYRQRIVGADRPPTRIDCPRLCRWSVKLELAIGHNRSNAAQGIGQNAVVESHLQRVLAVACRLEALSYMGYRTDAEGFPDGFHTTVWRCAGWPDHLRDALRNAQAPNREGKEGNDKSEAGSKHSC